MNYFVLSTALRIDIFVSILKMRKPRFSEKCSWDLNTRPFDPKGHVLSLTSHGISNLKS